MSTTINIWDTVKHMITAIGTVVAMSAVMWQVGEPHLEKFVNKVVDKRGLATQEQVSSIKKTVDSNARRGGEFRENQIEIQSSLGQVKILLQEQRTDFKDLLKELRQRP